MYEEDSWSDAEIGQELIDFLLRTGKIKEKSPSLPIQNTAIARRNDQLNNDRYDELIAAFNVILEEILLQTSLKSSIQDPAQTSQNSSTNPNDPESAVDEQSDNITNKCHKNYQSTNPMSRCLSPFEKELLQKINTLTNLLNSAVKRRNFDQELNDNFSESTQRDRREIHQNGHNLENNKNLSRGSSSVISKRQTSQSEIDDDQNPETSEDENNMESEDTMSKENILSKENNYGMDVHKIVEHIEDRFDHHDKETEEIDKNQHIGDNARKATQRCSIYVDNGLRIPMRLVQKPNKKFYLILDRQNLNRQRNQF